MTLIPKFKDIGQLNRWINENDEARTMQVDRTGYTLTIDIEFGCQMTIWAGSAEQILNALNDLTPDPVVNLKGKAVSRSLVPKQIVYEEKVVYQDRIIHKEQEVGTGWITILGSYLMKRFGWRIDQETKQAIPYERVEFN